MQYFSRLRQPFMVVWQTPIKETFSALTIYISTEAGVATQPLLCHTRHARDAEIEHHHRCVYYVCFTDMTMIFQKSYNTYFRYSLQVQHPISQPAQAKPALTSMSRMCSSYLKCISQTQSKTLLLIILILSIAGLLRSTTLPFSRSFGFSDRRLFPLLLLLFPMFILVIIDNRLHSVFVVMFITG